MILQWGLNLITLEDKYGFPNGRIYDCHGVEIKEPVVWADTRTGKVKVKIALDDGQGNPVIEERIFGAPLKFVPHDPEEPKARRLAVALAAEEGFAGT